MIALSDQLGGDQRRVSLVHGARLLFIVSTIPFIAQAFGYQPAPRPSSLSMDFAPGDLALLAALSALGYVLANACACRRQPSSGHCSAAPRPILPAGSKRSRLIS